MTPAMTYRTIVADPPWPYTHMRPFGDGAGLLRAPGAAMRYRLMPITEICAMQIPAERDAHLYLWTTNAFIEQAHQVARAWGFRPKTVITWVKVHQDDHARVSQKMGYYFRGATEHVVFAVRGSLRLKERNLPTAYLWPRVGQHSRKPEQFYDLVERASPGPYLELFARGQRRLGWSAWGNETAADIALPLTAAGSG